MALLVNLDAMIKRADFAQLPDADNTYETINQISIQNFTSQGLLGSLLRKPDFQRETNHWTPEQVVSLLECFINGDLIPSVILWKSPTYLFVIDGGHRLSILKAWVEDDYGDGPISRTYFDNILSKDQKRAADRTRSLVAETLGTFKHYETKIKNSEIDQTVSSIFSRALPVQWVKGDSDKAEASFFKINTQGTPLDTIEQSLLENRKKPIAIAARGIIRSGRGHKYWSKFEKSKSEKIEVTAELLHKTLFEPELSTPIKTLDLPLGGSKGIRSALQTIIEYLAIASDAKSSKSNAVDFGVNDEDGDKTIDLLKLAEKLTNRITGNDRGSLGLHPAIYYYGPSGIHSSPLFLGTAKFVREKLKNNDQTFFKTFTLKRSTIEDALITHKDLIATIMQKLGSVKRINSYALLMESIFAAAKQGMEITEQNLVDWAGLNGKILVGNEKSSSSEVSDNAKSKVFILTTLRSAPKCPICNGYIDTNKSMSYDHLVRVRDGGTGEAENVQITHPYCNQSMKN